MKVLVSDTSVLIDLERGSLLETSFRLPFEFAVPDLLYQQELKDHGGGALTRSQCGRVGRRGGGACAELSTETAVAFIAGRLCPRPRKIQGLDTAVRRWGAAGTGCGGKSRLVTAFCG